MRSWPCFCSSLPRPPSRLRRECTAVSTFRKLSDGMIDSPCSPGYVNLRSYDKELRTDHFCRPASQSLLHCASQVSSTVLGSIMPRSSLKLMCPLR